VSDQAATELGDFPFDLQYHATIPFEFGKIFSCISHSVDLYGGIENSITIQKCDWCL